MMIDGQQFSTKALQSLFADEKFEFLLWRTEYHDHTTSTFNNPPLDCANFCDLILYRYFLQFETLFHSTHSASRYKKLFSNHKVNKWSLTKNNNEKTRARSSPLDSSFTNERSRAMVAQRMLYYNSDRGGWDCDWLRLKFFFSELSDAFPGELCLSLSNTWWLRHIINHNRVVSEWVSE